LVICISGKESFGNLLVTCKLGIVYELQAMEEGSFLGSSPWERIFNVFFNLKENILL